MPKEKVRERATKQEANNVTDEKFAAIKLFTGQLAHAIGNPLFVITGKIEMLLEEGASLPENVKNDLETIGRHAERIRELVNLLYKFCCKPPKQLDSLDINDCIEKTLSLLSARQLELENIRIKKNFSDKLPLVKGDFNQLQAALMNLFINGYQAMPAGGSLEVKTSSPSGKEVFIEISDSGCGIKEEDIKNIFTPFFTTKKDSQGLGLAISYNTIRNHNGSIELRSEQNKGTTFTIRLPLAKEGKDVV